MPKILVLDVETKPSLVYSFQAYDANFSPEHVVSAGGLLCLAAKWLGEKEVFFFSEWTHSKTEMLNGIHALLDEADAVLTYNGDKFDLPILQGEFVANGFKPHAPVTSIDVLKTVRKFKFFMSRLAFVGPLLKVGDKIKHEGFDLWKSVMAGDPKAQAKMEKYNVQDVHLLEKLYNRVRPFIRNHPHLGETKSECGACGSNHVQFRGWRRTKAFKIRRTQCQDCGSWSDGAKVKI